MTRGRVVAAVCLVALGLGAYWLSGRVYWTDVKIPLPPRGEALTNPFYAAQRFAERLGATTSWERVLTLPPTNAVLVLSGWHWDLIETRRRGIEQWVESGGRLVVDSTIAGSVIDFERWSGIGRHYEFPDDEKEEEEPPPCLQLTEIGAEAVRGDNRQRWLCGMPPFSYVTTEKAADWSLEQSARSQAMRVRVGRGSVTVINASPFKYRALFDGDHAAIFVAATGLRRGLDVHFLSEDEYPPLLVLLWQYATPVVLLALGSVALMLWRGAIRLGPLAAPDVRGRRSLAEQIRGTGEFTAQHGGADALHAAAVRALEEAALRQAPAYKALPPAQRTEVLARLTGVGPDRLAAAIHHPGARAGDELRATIALLEAARRHMLEQRRAGTTPG
jgi:hypothetical protein